MKIKNITIICIFFSFILINCSNDKSRSKLLNQVITRDNITSLTEQLISENTLSKEEIDLIAMGITRLTLLNQDTLIGKTLADVMKIQREAELESSIAGLKLASTKSEIVLSHKFEMLQFFKNDSGDYKTNLITFKVTNLSDNNIKNLQGYLNIMNQQNKIIKKFPINIKKELEAHQSYTLTTPPYIHDDNNENDRELRIEGNILKPAWQPILVEFSNGKKLGPVQ